MDLERISSNDLVALLEAFRAMGQEDNRVAVDLFCIVEREMLRRHESTELTHYTDDELAGAGHAYPRNRCGSGRRNAGRLPCHAFSTRDDNRLGQRGGITRTHSTGSMKDRAPRIYRR